VIEVPKIIEAQGLTKVYGGNLKAVDHISFSIDEGHLFGFLGPNGAGKTTTIKMLNTLATITEGKAIVAGHDVQKEPDAVRRSIGLVPQELTVDDELKGIENLLLSAKLYHVPDHVARQRAQELLKLARLDDAANRLVGTYSGGMRKRLELIVGLMHNPKILFLDEPTLGLDIQTRASMWEYIKHLNKEQKMTIFMTTHYLEEADSLCETIAIIDHGTIKESGTPAELKSKVGGDVLTIEMTDGTDVTSFLENIGGVTEVKKTDSTYRIKLPKAEDALPAIFEGLAHRGLRVKNIAFTKPTLDQVFLDVTGRTLRDAEEGASDSLRQRFTSMRSR
jgi:ABC-2 type transport system ATP-binding protein